MKIIFLDVDGVLNGNFWNETHQKEISDFTKVDATRVRLLAKLVNDTGAKVVMHSAWRNMFDENMMPCGRLSQKLYDILKSNGIVIYDKTPDFSTEDIRKTKKFSLVKASEIFAWLDTHSDVESWVVLEDLDLNNDIIAQHQIRTNQDIGLLPEDVENAKTILNIPIQQKARKV